jgi:hypothetical protein
VAADGRQEHVARPVAAFLLTVSKLNSGAFRAEVEGPGVTERSPEFRTRLAAQGWADNSAGGAA